MGPAPQMLETQIISSADWPATLQSPWQSLVKKSQSASIFQTYEWQVAWWTHYAGRSKPAIFQFLSEGNLVGIMPMVIKRGPWNALIPMGAGKSDYLHPLIQTGFEDEVSRALSIALSSHAATPIVQLNMVRDDSKLRQSVSFGEWKPVSECPVLQLTEPYEEYFQSLGKNLRYKLSKFRRYYLETERAKFVVSESADTEAMMEMLFALHTQRWNNRGEPGGYAFGKNRKLFQNWAASAQANGWLRLLSLTVDDVVVGVLLASTLNGVCYYQNMGFSERYGPLSPGLQLMNESIRRSIEENCRTYDFLRGADEYKLRWKPQAVHSNWNWQFVHPGIEGKAASGWYGCVLPFGVRARRAAVQLRNRMAGGAKQKQTHESGTDQR